MRYLRKFENFTKEDIVNENVFQKAIGWINKKVATFTNKKITTVVQKATEIINKSPKIQEQILNIKSNLSQDEKNKLINLAKDPNSIVKKSENIPEIANVKESVELVLEGADVQGTVGKILTKIGAVGGGLTAISVVVSGIYSQIVGSAEAFQGISWPWVIVGIVAAIIISIVGAWNAEASDKK